MMFNLLGERSRERLVILAFTVILGGLSVKAYFFDRVRLSALAERRAEEVSRLQQRDIMVTAQVRAFQAEIEALKTDSEETSLIARTTLGMVLGDEVIYQLNRITYPNQ